MIADACYEHDSRELICGLGGVLVDESSGTKLFFSCELSNEQRRILGEPSQKQIIFETETPCAILAYALWAERLRDKMFFFIRLQ